jgi:hypothetical protein
MIQAVRPIACEHRIRNTCESATLLSIIALHPARRLLDRECLEAESLVIQASFTLPTSRGIRRFVRYGSASPGWSARVSCKVEGRSIKLTDTVLL